MNCLIRNIDAFLAFYQALLILPEDYPFKVKELTPYDKVCPFSIEMNIDRIDVETSVNDYDSDDGVQNVITITSENLNFLAAFCVSGHQGINFSLFSSSRIFSSTQDECEELLECSGFRFINSKLPVRENFALAQMAVSMSMQAVEAKITDGFDSRSILYLFWVCLEIPWKL